MTSSVAEPFEKLDIGLILSKSFEIIKDGARTFAPVALICRGVPGIASLAASTTILSSSGQITGSGSAALLPLSVVTWLGFVISQGALIYGAAAHINGERPSIGDLLAQGMRLMPGLFLLDILWFLGVWLGTIFLIVPGLILLCAWPVAGAVRVVEKAGFGLSFGRSRKLTRGSRWRILLLLLIVGLVYFVVQAAVGGVALATLGNVAMRGVTGIIGIGVGAAFNIVGTVVTTVLYFELRRIKEGHGPEGVAAVFD